MTEIMVKVHCLSPFKNYDLNLPGETTLEELINSVKAEQFAIFRDEIVKVPK